MVPNSNSTDHATAPYRDEMKCYLDLDWPGVIPCDWPKKGMPPDGFTGAKDGLNWGVYPTDAQVATWAETRATCSLGLRVPDDVIVIDVDCYDGKKGCETLEWIVEMVGEPLPATWYSTSRQDGSRKLFYRVPRYGPGFWRGEPGEGVEIIRHDFRWVRVWPSRNPRTGGMERWFDPNDVLSETPPRPSDLTELPPAWVEGLRTARAKTRSFGAASANGAREGAPDGEAFDWAPFAAGPGTYPPGDQDVVLHQAACSLRAQGVNDETAVFVLKTVVESFANEPSSPKGDWTLEHAVDKWRRVKEAHAPGRSVEDLPPALARFVDGLGEAAATPERRRALAREEATRWARRQLDQRELEEARGPRPKTTMREFSKLEPTPQVIPGVLAADVNLLGGPSAAGKSLLARDWAIQVAQTGRTVLWVASEGMDDVGVRWASHPDWEQVADRVYMLDPVNLVGDADVDWLVGEYAAERPALVVFDLVYDMGMRDDDGFKDVGPVIRSCKRLREELGCGTLLIGHSGHGGERRFRGSSSWRQRAYVEWHMADGLLDCPKSKIADRKKLSRTYRLDYPVINLTTIGEVITDAAARDAAIKRDVQEHPGDSDSARARRLADPFGVTEDYARRLVRGVTK